MKALFQFVTRIALGLLAALVLSTVEGCATATPAPPPPPPAVKTVLVPQMVQVTAFPAASATSAPRPAATNSPRPPETRAVEPTPTNAPALSPLSPPMIPQTGIYLGAWVNPAKGADPAQGNGGTSVEISQLPQFQTDLGGRLPAVLNFYTAFLNPSPLTTLQDIEAKGSIPLISWGCEDVVAIGGGQYDQQITQYANNLKTFGHPVFLRWFWEMNLNDAQRCLGSAGPSGYLAAWRHIYTFFHQVGSSNVVFVWCPGLSGGIPGMDKFFPGADYVDWIGIDGYLKDANAASSFAGLFGSWYTAFLVYHKPLIVVETGAPPTEQGAYFDGIGQTVPTQFPNLKGILYFDAPGKNGEWELSQPGLAAFAKLLANSYFSFHQ